MGNDMRKKFKLQSAMEYLMTYGWAILIIAVVLGVLFQMGVFNSSSLTVRIPPGACKVLRTSAAVNLVGQCSGILPKYVAVFSGSSSSYVTVPDATSLKPSRLSVFAWVNYPSPLPPSLLGIVSKSGDEHHGFQLGWEMRSGNNMFWAEIGDGNTLVWDQCNSALSSPPTAGSVHQVGMTYDGSSLSTYLDGKFVLSCTYNAAIAWNTDPAKIDSIINGFYGQWQYISNVQIYNTSLDASQVQALYLEGIGGAPIAPSNIVGWWPLNGDTKDYSGNNNNGAPTAITFTAQYGK
jgi:hypothetical protein